MSNGSEYRIEKELIRGHFGKYPDSFEKKFKGFINNVFIFSVDGKQMVLRTNHDSNILKGFSCHHAVLSSLNIPVPNILIEDCSATRYPFAYLILSFIEGNELRDCIVDLPKNDIDAIAHEIASIQKKVMGISSQTAGFGRSILLGKDLCDKTWHAYICNTIERRMHRLQEIKEEANEEILKSAQQLWNEVISMKELFDAPQQCFFLDDLTDKNFIVSHGSIAAIIDLDHIAYGDPRQLLGKIQSIWPRPGTKGHEYFMTMLHTFGYDGGEHTRIIALYALVELLGELSVNLFSKNAIDSFLFLSKEHLGQ